MTILDPYLSPAQLEQELRKLVRAGVIEAHPYGQSVQGRELVAYRCGPAQEGQARPAVLLGANLHGIEVIGTYLALHLLRSLGHSAALDTLVKRCDLWVIPSYNPDGYARTFEREGKGSVAQLRCNARGVDLNRNFPRPCARARKTLGFAGSSTPGKATYRGPHALSEPESAALFTWLSQTKIHACLNLHSFFGALIPARVRGAHDFGYYKQLHRAYMAPSPRPRFWRLHTRLVDAWTGELEDAQHHFLGTWASCVELVTVAEIRAQRHHADRLFWRFNPKKPRLHAEREFPRIISAFDAALRFPAPRESFSKDRALDLRV